jgi:hypothetical protein
MFCVVTNTHSSPVNFFLWVVAITNVCVLAKVTLPYGELRQITAILRQITASCNVCCNKGAIWLQSAAIKSNHFTAPVTLRQSIRVKVSREYFSKPRSLGKGNYGRKKVTVARHAYRRLTV